MVLNLTSLDDLEFLDEAEGLEVVPNYTLKRITRG